MKYRQKIDEGKETKENAEVLKESINEANFGFLHIQAFVDKLNEGALVLEVGCGSGLLLAMIKEHNESISAEGIEPFGNGFDSFKSLNSHVKKQGVAIHNVAYEDFDSNKTYNLIYSVNVFEHFDEWKNFLGFVENNLSQNGVCIILCPNYGFPYEPHFSIPIIATKKITGKIFGSYISKFEQEKNFFGRWDSLNFVKLSQVKREIKKRSTLDLKVIHSITNELIERAS